MRKAFINAHGLKEYAVVSGVVLVTTFFAFGVAFGLLDLNVQLNSSGAFTADIRGSNCTLGSGQSTCGTTISWNTTGLTSVCVYLVETGQQFACGLNGSQWTGNISTGAGWLTTSPVTFALCTTTRGLCALPLDTVMVRAVSATVSSSSQSVCSSFSTPLIFRTQWGSLTSVSSIVPPTSVCGSNNLSASLRTTTSVGSGVYAAAGVWEPTHSTHTKRTANVSFMIPTVQFSNFNHFSLHPIFHKTNFRRSGGAVFKDKLYVQHENCGSTNLYSAVSIPGGLRSNTWYRIESVNEKTSTSYSVRTTLKTINGSVIATTSRNFTGTCAWPSMSSSTYGWLVGELATASSAVVYIDDFQASVR